MPNDRLFTTGQAADLLGVSKSTLARAVQAGELIPLYRTPGGHVRFRPEDVEAYLVQLHAPLEKRGRVVHMITRRPRARE